MTNEELLSAARARIESAGEGSKDRTTMLELFRLGFTTVTSMKPNDVIAALGVKKGMVIEWRRMRHLAPDAFAAGLVK
jgi:hypothetical protein